MLIWLVLPVFCGVYFASVVQARPLPAVIFTLLILYIAIPFIWFIIRSRSVFFGILLPLCLLNLIGPWLKVRHESGGDQLLFLGRILEPIVLLIATLYLTFTNSDFNLEQKICFYSIILFQIVQLILIYLFSIDGSTISVLNLVLNGTIILCLVCFYYFYSSRVEKPAVKYGLLSLGWWYWSLFWVQMAVL